MLKVWEQMGHLRVQQVMTRVELTHTSCMGSQERVYRKGEWLKLKSFGARNLGAIFRACLCSTKSKNLLNLLFTFWIYLDYFLICSYQQCELILPLPSLVSTLELTFHLQLPNKTIRNTRQKENPSSMLFARINGHYRTKRSIMNVLMWPWH